MEQDYDYLLSTINYLQRCIIELEKRVAILEEGKTSTKDCELKKSTRTERFLFNGVSYKKRRLVLAVVNEYVNSHPGITLEELAEAFPSYKIKNSFVCVVKENLIQGEDKKRRYFVEEKDLIVLSDGTKVAVTNQWGLNIKNFIEFVEKEYGYNIKEE